MWLNHQAIAIKRAPPAGESFAVLEEINRTLEFAVPSAARDFPPAFINQDEGARPQDRKHRPILQAYQTVPVLFHIEPVEEAEWRLAPLPDQMAQERGLGQIDLRGRIRNRNSTV